MATKAGMQYFRTTKQMSKEIKEMADSLDVSQSELARMAVVYFLRIKPVITIETRLPQAQNEKGK